MSIALTKPSTYGVDVNFWKVTHREFNDKADGVLVEICGYASKTAYNAKARPLDRVMLTSAQLPYADVKGMNPNQMRDYILTNVPEFAGGTPD